MPWHMAATIKKYGKHPAKPMARTWLYIPLFTPTLLKELLRSAVKEADHTIWHVPRGLVSKLDDLFTDRIL